MSPETSLLSRGSRLSSAEIVRDSVPVCSMVSSPAPVSSTLVKPLTCRDSVASWPEPCVAEHAISKTTTVNMPRAAVNALGNLRTLAPPVRGQVCHADTATSH